MSETTDERVKLTREEVMSKLPFGDDIHTFRQAGRSLVGADWTRNQILIAERKYGFELSGETAASMGHGMVFLDETGHVFVASKN